MVSTHDEMNEEGLMLLYEGAEDVMLVIPFAWTFASLAIGIAL